MIENKLDMYIIEMSRSNMTKLASMDNIEELVTSLSKLTKSDRKKVIDMLDKKKRQEVEKFMDGGLI